MMVPKFAEPTEAVIVIANNKESSLTRLHGSINAIKFYHISCLYPIQLMNHVSLQLMNLQIFLNSFSCRLFRLTYASSDLATLDLIFSPYFRIDRFSLYVPKPHKPRNGK